MKIEQLTQKSYEQTSSRQRVEILYNPWSRPYINPEFKESIILAMKAFRHYRSFWIFLTDWTQVRALLSEQKQI